MTAALPGVLSPAARDVLNHDSTHVTFYWDEKTDTWSATLVCHSPALELHVAFFPHPQYAFADLLARLEECVSWSIDPRLALIGSAANRKAGEPVATSLTRCLDRHAGEFVFWLGTIRSQSSGRTLFELKGSTDDEVFAGLEAWTEDRS